MSLTRQENVGSVALPFVNRVSDLLFAWARLANASAGVADVEWHPDDPGRLGSEHRP